MRLSGLRSIGALAALALLCTPTFVSAGIRGGVQRRVSAEPAVRLEAAGRIQNTTDPLQVIPPAPAPDAVSGDEMFPDLSVPTAPVVAATGCGRVVGRLGGYFSSDIDSFFASLGMTVSPQSAASIAGGSLAGVDALYVLRDGAGAAISVAGTIDAWVNGGGILITEFTATDMLYTTFGYLSGALVDGFWVPSGTVCGGNTVITNSPGNPIAAGLPATFACSGDPAGVFYVYNQVAPEMCVIASIQGSDRNGDGIDDPWIGVVPVGAGSVVAIHSDFGDWQSLQDPRSCPGGPGSASCNRASYDETVLANAVCLANGCGASGRCTTCDDVRATIDAADIDVEGVRNSFHAKVNAACAALDRDQHNTSGNILCALLNEVTSQSGKHVTEASAQAIIDCVKAFAAANAIPLVGGRCGGVEQPVP